MNELMMVSYSSQCLCYALVSIYELNETVAILFSFAVSLIFLSSSLFNPELLYPTQSSVYSQVFLFSFLTSVS